uniref:Uncharacterized protein n=1 Tax=Eutreptiella gymnastica TaxID=73025 RepID=A0A7S4LJA9_9EUGL
MEEGEGEAVVTDSKNLVTSCKTHVYISAFVPPHPHTHTHTQTQWNSCWQRGRAQRFVMPEGYGGRFLWRGPKLKRPPLRSLISVVSCSSVDLEDRASQEAPEIRASARRSRV